MKVVYLHGMSSSGQSATARQLQKALAKAEVIAPDIPVHPREALIALSKLAATLDPADTVIAGTSLGGAYAQMFKQFKRILINPSFHTSTILRRDLGTRRPFHTPRRDGATDFMVSEKLCREFEEMEERQFDKDFGIFIEGAPMKPESVYAFFGNEDTTVNCREEYLSHYRDYEMFEGGHRLPPAVTLGLVVPLIWRFSLIDSPELAMTIALRIIDAGEYRREELIEAAGGDADAVDKITAYYMMEEFLCESPSGEISPSGDFDSLSALCERNRWNLYDLL